LASRGKELIEEVIYPQNTYRKERESASKIVKNEKKRYRFVTMEKKNPCSNQNIGSIATAR